MTEQEKDKVEQFIEDARDCPQNVYAIQAGIVIHSGDKVLVIRDAEVIHVDEYDERCPY